MIEIQVRRQTVIEWLVILIIAGMLVGLCLPPVVCPMRVSEEDLELNDWAPGPEQSVAPDEDMRVEKVDISGEWTYGYRTIFWIRPHKDDGYQVRFHSHSRSRSCNLERTATYEQGVLVLNRPVKEMHGLAYQRLYTVRIDGRDYLLPSARVMEFQDGRAVDWSRYDKHGLLEGLLEGCVLQRSPPGQLIDEDPFGAHE